MTQAFRTEYVRPPSALGYMALSVLPKSGIEKVGGFPDIVAAWKNCKPTMSSVEAFSNLTGLPHNRVYHPVFLNTIAFRLAMTVLTHSSFPEPIWGVLQVRNAIVQRQCVELTESFDLEVRIAGHRKVEKGAEVDLCMTITTVGQAPVWESTSTFFIRGNVNAKCMPPIQAPPKSLLVAHSEWEIPGNGRWTFAALTGDYNGIHMWDWYARLHGFNAAFSHSQKVLGQILSKMREHVAFGANTRLATWLKGPVYYGSTVELKVSENREPLVFALFVNGDKRPAIIGQYSSGTTLDSPSKSI